MKTLTYEPRFLVFRGISYLIRLTKDGDTILGVDGPYQAVGEPGVSPAETAKAFKELLDTAVALPSLGYDDLPQASKDQLDGVSGTPGVANPDQTVGNETISDLAQS